MLQGILHFGIYAVLGGLAGWLFKLVASLIEMIFLFGFFGILTGFKGNNLDERILQFPKRFVFILVSKNTVVGSTYAVMVFMVTAEYLQRTGANLWLYIGLSIFWSLLIHVHTKGFHGMYFFTSTIMLVFFWLGFGIISFIVPILTFLISLAYYLGRIEVFNQEILKEESL